MSAVWYRVQALVPHASLQDNDHHWPGYSMLVVSRWGSWRQNCATAYCWCFWTCFGSHGLDKLSSAYKTTIYLFLRLLYINYTLIWTILCISLLFIYTSKGTFAFEKIQEERQFHYQLRYRLNDFSYRTYLDLKKLINVSKQITFRESNLQKISDKHCLKLWTINRKIRVLD